MFMLIDWIWMLNINVNIIYNCTLNWFMVLFKWIMLYTKYVVENDEKCMNLGSHIWDYLWTIVWICVLSKKLCCYIHW